MPRSLIVLWLTGWVVTALWIVRNHLETNDACRRKDYGFVGGLVLFAFLAWAFLLGVFIMVRVARFLGWLFSRGVTP